MMAPFPFLGSSPQRIASTQCQMMSAKARREGGGGPDWTEQSDDALHLILSHVESDVDLASATATSSRFRHAGYLLLRERRLARARAEEEAHRERERFAAFRDDARVVGTVIRHMVHHALGRGGGVSRLFPGGKSLALGMEESAIAQVVFNGEPLGAAGAEAAIAQARGIMLSETPATVDGRAFALVIRANVLIQRLTASPRLAKLLCFSA